VLGNTLLVAIELIPCKFIVFALLFDENIVGPWTTFVVVVVT